MADFNIVIKVDSGPAVRGAKAVEGQLQRTEAQANKLQQTIKRAFAGLAAGQSAVQSIRFLANFGQEMSTVKAIVGSTGKLTEDQFARMRKAAIDLGTTTRFTATQAASGMLFLARSGYDAQQIMEAIPGVLNLAQAGALDLGHAADIATNILKGFNLNTAETARVVDVLALAANSANTTVEQIGQAMKFVAPIAAGVNMTLEETTGAIQTLSNAGLQASMAGTGLRRVIGALEGPTVAQEKVLNSLGLTVDDVKVSTVGLIPALEKIRGKTNDIGVLLRLFGQRGGPAAAVLSNMADDAKKFAEANKFAAGTGQEVARVMDDNLNGALLRVKSAFQGLLILWGDVSAVTGLRRFLEGLANTLRFLANRAEAVDKALRVVAAGYIVYAIAAGQAKAATVAFTRALASNPVGLIVVGLTALVAALVLFKDDLSLAGEGFITFGDIGSAAMDQIRAGLNGLLYFMQQLVPQIGSSWQEVFSNIVTFGLAMVQGLAQVFDRIAGFLYSIDRVSTIVSESVSSSFEFAWKSIANSAGKYMQVAIKFWVDGINSLADKLGADFLKIDPVEFTGPLYELSKEAELTGKDIGKALEDGLRTSGLEDAFLNMLSDAEKKAIARIRLPEEVTASTPLGNPPPTEIFGPDEVPGGGKTSKVSFGQYMADLSRQAELLKLTSREMEVQQGIYDAEDKILGGLNETRERLLANMLVYLQQRREEAALYDEIRGPQEDLLAQQEALNRLFIEGRITIEEYQTTMDSLRISMLDLNTDINSGLSRGLLKIKAQIQDLASTAENVLTNAFNGALDALTNFVTTGEINFSGLVDSILQDLTRLLIQKALLSLIPGLGPAAGAVPGFATGGQFTVGGSGGTDSQPVRFDATPGERVTVETPAQQRASDNQQSGGQAGVTIINVSSREEALAAMASRQGQQVIINTIGENRNVVRNQLA